MKTMKLLFFAAVTVVLMGCNDLNFLKDNADEEFIFNKELLKQTAWTGTSIERNSKKEVRLTSNVVFQFYTTENGEYSIVKKDAWGVPFLIQEKFNYEIEDKMIIMNLSGIEEYYFIVEFTENKIVLATINVGSEITITLNRKY